MHRKLIYLGISLGIIFSCSSVLSCRKDKDGEAVSRNDSAAEEASTSPQGDATAEGMQEISSSSDRESITLGPQGESDVAVEEDVQSNTTDEETESREDGDDTAEPLSASFAVTLYALRRGDAPIIEDYKIGPLIIIPILDSREKEIVATVQNFLEQVGAGKIPNEILFPEVKEELIRRVTVAVETGYSFNEYRVGTITENEQGEARVNIRVFAEIGSTPGELYLHKKDEEWYISDIIWDLAVLGEPAKEDEGQYEPSVYRWLGY